MSLSDKSESVNERTHTESTKIKFHILGFAGSADELIRQLANKIITIITTVKTYLRSVFKYSKQCIE